MTNIKYLVSLIALITCLGCGGGGGGGNGAVGAAAVSIEAAPKRFDVGDRTTVKIEIASIHPDGILLKVRFPNGLRYVKSSAFLEVDGDSTDVSPRDTVSVSPDNYIVFAFPQSTFRDEDYGRLTFELLGAAAVTNGKVGVDPDVNYTVPFSGSDPKFQEEAELELSVLD